MPQRSTGYGGTTLQAPLRVRNQNPGQNQSYTDEVFRSCPIQRVDRLEDFDAGLDVYQLAEALFNGSNANVISTTGTSRAFFIVPRDGILVAADFVGEDALATSDTNYVTFAVINRLGSGSGSTAMLAATDPNTTKATGGTAITAKSARSLTVNGTAANLRVNAGDVIEVTVAATGTLANVVDFPRVRLRIQTIPSALVPRSTRTAGSVLISPVAGSANGEIICQLDATNEAQVAGFDFGDQVVIPGNKAFFFQARVKISGVAANNRFVFGLATAYNATFDSVTKHAWFRVEGNSLSLLVETDDGTTDNDDQDTNQDLTADTYVVLTIDGRDLGRIKFYLDENLVKELSAAAFSTTAMQVVAYIQKASGTGTLSFTADNVRWSYDRR